MLEEELHLVGVGHYGILIGRWRWFVSHVEIVGGCERRESEFIWVGR
jgi:hypothetical protein